MHELPQVCQKAIPLLYKQVTTIMAELFKTVGYSPLILLDILYITRHRWFCPVKEVPSVIWLGVWWCGAGVGRPGARPELPLRNCYIGAFRYKPRYPKRNVS